MCVCCHSMHAGRRPRALSGFMGAISRKVKSSIFHSLPPFLRCLPNVFATSRVQNTKTTPTRECYCCIVLFTATTRDAPEPHPSNQASNSNKRPRLPKYKYYIVYRYTTHLPAGDRLLKPRHRGEVSVHPAVHEGGHGPTEREGVVAVKVAANARGRQAGEQAGRW